MWAWILFCGFSLHLLFFILIKTYKLKIKYLNLFDYLLISILYSFLLIILCFLYLSFIPDNITSTVHITPQIFTLNECKLIISIAEDFAIQQGGWNTSRHKWYPTTDISAYSIHNMITIHNKTIKFNDWINNTVESVVYSHLSRNFHIPRDRYRMQDLFIVKYDVNGQHSLPIHRDSSLVTFNIALSQVNEDYHGGGTKFLFSEEEIINVPRGSMVSHESKIYHSGYALTSGTRYILIGFVNVASPFFDIWWRGFGGYARCLELPLDPIKPKPHYDYHTVCKSWFWITNYYIHAMIDHLYYSFNPSLSPYHQGETPVHPSSQHSHVQSFPYFFFFLLAFLFLLLLIVIGLLISICCCSDDFTATYCYYPLTILGILTQQQQLFDLFQYDEKIKYDDDGECIKDLRV